MDQNGVKIAIFAAKSQKSPPPQVLSVIRLSCINLFRTGPQLDNFMQKIIVWF